MSISYRGALNEVQVDGVDLIKFDSTVDKLIANHLGTLCSVDVASPLNYEYDDLNGVGKLTVTLGSITTDSITEGKTNKFFTDSRAILACAGTYQPLITSGTIYQYWRGDETWQTLDTAVRDALSGSTNITYSSSTGVISLPTTLTGLSSVSSTSFVGALTGNASTATALSTAGSANQFWKNGNSWAQPTQADISGLTTASSPTFAGLTLSSPLTYANGGTGQSSYAKGDIVYASAANTLSKLTIGSTNQVLTSNASGIPEWSNLSSFGVSSLASADSNITCSSSTGAVTIQLASVLTGLSAVSSTVFVGSLTGSSTGVANGTVGTFYKAGGWQYIQQSDVTGLKTSDAPTFTGLTLSTTPLAYSSGGTGQSSYTAGDIVYCSATNVLSKLGIGSTNQVLATVGGLPQWTNGVLTVSGTSNQITSSTTLGAVTLGLPSVITAPGSLSTTTSLASGSYLTTSTYGDIGSYLKVGSYASIGVAADSQKNLYIARDYTGSGTTTYGIHTASALTAPSGATTNTLAGFALLDTFKSNTSNTGASFYGIKNTPSFNATSSTITSAYGSYIACTNVAGTTTNLYAHYAGPLTLTAGTVTNGYGGYFSSPGAGTNQCALYSADLQVGGSLMSGSTKSGWAYIDGRLQIGGSTNNGDRALSLNKTYTSTSSSTYGSAFFNVITTPSGVGSNVLYGVHMADSLTTNTSNTGATFAGLSVQPSMTGTPVAIGSAYGIYCLPTVSGTTTSVYGGYFAAPSGTATNTAALWADSFQCGGTVSGSVPSGRPYDKTGYLMPVGTIIAIGFKPSTPTAVAGWYYCNGDSLLRAGTYADLYAVIGNSYGTADGTHFNVPALQGRFLRGMNDGSGNDPDSSATYRTTIKTNSATGDACGSLQADDFRTHYHALQLNMRDGPNWYTFNGYCRTTDGAGTYRGNGGNTTVPSNNMVTGNETRPKNVYVCYIIKY